MRTLLTSMTAFAGPSACGKSMRISRLACDWAPNTDSATMSASMIFVSYVLHRSQQVAGRTLADCAKFACENQTLPARCLEQTDTRFELQEGGDVQEHADSCLLNSIGVGVAFLPGPSGTLVFRNVCLENRVNILQCIGVI